METIPEYDTGRNMTRIIIAQGTNCINLFSLYIWHLYYTLRKGYLHLHFQWCQMAVGELISWTIKQGADSADNL
jgi:hypothetical protein